MVCVWGQVCVWLSGGIWKSPWTWLKTQTQPVSQWTLVCPAYQVTLLTSSTPTPRGP